MTVRITLAITTHARADALARVLACVRAQTRPPDEAIVAEDGTDPATSAVVAHHAAVSAVTSATSRLQHVQQPHLGFRVARLRNLAIAAATGDYIVFVDGDMLLHPRFLEDHARCARPGRWTQGVRVPLDAMTTRASLAGALDAVADGDGAHDHHAHSVPGLLARGRFGLRRAALWHAPRLQRALREAGARLLAVKSCNQGFWRADLLRVNGFDERFEGWGPEDKELCARLAHAGVRRQALLGGGIACHLHHPPAARDRRAFNESLLAATLAARMTRCERGVDGHLGATRDLATVARAADARATPKGSCPRDGVRAAAHRVASFMPSPPVQRTRCSSARCDPGAAC